LAPTVTHQKVSLIPDAGDATLIEPSDWNATHVLTGVQGTIALTTTGSSGASTFDGTTLNIPNYSITDTGITQLTGDVTAGPGNGSQAATLPNIVTGSTQTKITYNAKGQVTAGAQASFSDISGTASIGQGGTGATTAPAARAALIVPTYCTNRAALQALVGATSAVAWLEEVGRQGEFQWNSANLSTQVTLDTQQAIYIPPASDTTGASGAWVRQFNGAQSLQWAGALPSNSTTVNGTAVGGAAALIPTYGPIQVPVGIYPTNIGFSVMPKSLAGPGQLQTAASNNMAPNYINQTAAPTSLGTPSSILTAFNGDLTNLNYTFGKSLTGSSSLGAPATGYEQDPECAALYGYMFNTSGHNQSTSTGDGRTGASMLHMSFSHGGQGDFFAYHTGGIVTSTLAGATSFLANPAIGALNGSMFAGATGSYLNMIELDAEDQGFQAAAIGAVFNFNRSVATSTLGEVWMGVRAQSSGSQAADVAYSLSGSWKRGLDVGAATLDTNKAAITLSADQKQYLNSTQSGTVSWSQTVGTEWLGYNSSASSIDLVMKSVPAIQMTTVATPVNYLGVQSRETGVGPVISAQGSDTNVGLIFTTKGTARHAYRTEGVSGPVQFTISDTASAVNNLQATGAIATAGPVLAAIGSDTNIDINLTPKGTGIVRVAGAQPAIVDAEQVTILSADNTAPTNVSTAQNVFPTGQGTLTVQGATTYEFEAQYWIQRSAGTTSHTTTVLFGGTATYTDLHFIATTANPTGNVLGAVSAIVGGTSGAVVTAANTSATENLMITIRGTMRINAAGTVIPQFQYSTAPGGAPTVKIGSFFRCWPIGSNTVTQVGNWS